MENRIKGEPRESIGIGSQATVGLNRGMEQGSYGKTGASSVVNSLVVETTEGCFESILGVLQI